MVATVISLFFAVITPAIFEWVKKEPWIPLITQHSSKLNAVLAFIVAVTQAVGITFAWNGTDGTLVVAGLNLSSIALAGITAALAWLSQELTYRLAVKK